MKGKLTIAVLNFLILFSYGTYGSNTVEVDICVYGGTSSGIIAAYTAKKLGKTVVVIEPGNSIGGLTTGGLGATDIGNKYAVTGLAKDFYRRLGGYYGKFEQWTFEPHVADQVYQDLIKSASLDIVKNHRLVKVKKEDGWIKEITVENALQPNSSSIQVIKAKMFIDCTYEGDLMAKSGVSYAIGRESNAEYGETYNGVQVSEFHQLPDGIDPYRIEGNAKSGLVWGVDAGKLMATGTGDKKIQAYNFRLCLTQDQDNLIPFTKPERYQRDRYELLARILKKENWETIHSSFKIRNLADGSRAIDHQGGFLIKNMPNGKTDFNNFGGFSTDMIGANYSYPEGDYKTRAQIWQNHVDYTKGLLYFLSTDKAVPAHIKAEMKTWGFPKDEFKLTGGFPNQLYVREARRMVGELVMSQKHCEGVEVVEDQVGMAAYGMDSHNIQRIVVNGMVKNEGDVQVGVKYPYPISYRAIIPKANECKNLLVPVCVSSTHIAFGSIRMEPVFMVLGQSAATAAVQAITNGQSVQSIDVKKLQHQLTSDPLLDGAEVETLVDNNQKDKVTVKGVWETVRGGYGRDVLMAKSGSQNDYSVIFKPGLAKAGKYELFTYFPNVDDKSESTTFIIGDGKSTKELTVQEKNIKRIGLTSGEWVFLGVYEVEAGDGSFVEVTNKGSKGKVTADAIIWKPIR